MSKPINECITGNNTEPFFLPGKPLSHLPGCFPHSLLEPNASDLDSCLAFLPPQQGGAQISLAEVCQSGERSTRWYNLLSYKYLKKQSRELKAAGATASSPGPESAVSWARVCNNHAHAQSWVGSLKALPGTRQLGRRLLRCKEEGRNRGVEG